VKDLNDCLPVFVEEVYNVTIREDEPIDYRVLTVLAIDKDVSGD